MLKILALLGSGDKQASGHMYTVLGDKIRKSDSMTNIGNAVLYECSRIATWVRYARGVNNGANCGALCEGHEVQHLSELIRLANKVCCANPLSPVFSFALALGEPSVWND
ncbi:AP-4 complex subunit [Vigna angularis]|uniref:AP-4 complex subunit n=1 Tax=Phaseolus angularis TaxID=3914 RepID=A0A8T0JJQ4_PHAAN|nr:AP-4 complex subunit [Vigna angularis]